MLVGWSRVGLFNIAQESADPGILGVKDLLALSEQCWRANGSPQSRLWLYATAIEPVKRLLRFLL